MDFNEILSGIGTVGFPIIASCGIFWYMTKQLEVHRQETKELQEVIANNTVVLAELKQVIADNGK